jgi:hypothetical protein
LLCPFDGMRRTLVLAVLGSTIFASLVASPTARATLVCEAGDDIGIAADDGTDPRVLVPVGECGVSCYRPRISPDGRTVGYVADRSRAIEERWPSVPRVGHRGCWYTGRSGLRRVHLVTRFHDHR